MRPENPNSLISGVFPHVQVAPAHGLIIDSRRHDRQTSSFCETATRTILLFLVRWLLTTLRPRVSLQLEVVALRHQLSVYQRTCRRPRISPADRILWSYLARVWAGWREHLFFVKPDTIIAWQRKWFRNHWRPLSQSRTPGRPAVTKELQAKSTRLANPKRCGVLLVYDTHKRRH